MKEKIVELESEILRLQRELAALKAESQDKPVASYIFDTLNGEISLDELFDGRSDLLVVHNMGKACSYCTAYADGFNGILPHLLDRTAFVVSSPDSPEDQSHFAASRAWKFDMVSTKRNTFAHDMGFEETPGDHWPGVSAFTRDSNGRILRTGFTSFDPGDNYSPLWPLISLLKGSEQEWGPKNSYSETGACCSRAKAAS